MLIKTRENFTEALTNDQDVREVARMIFDGEDIDLAEDETFQRAYFALYGAHDNYLTIITDLVHSIIHVHARTETDIENAIAFLHRSIDELFDFELAQQPPAQMT